jgi:hypothetical protein
MTLARFPNAPEGAYVCEEGWLIIDDEAWTEEEWAPKPGGRPVTYDDERHRRDRERNKHGRKR